MTEQAKKDTNSKTNKKTDTNVESTDKSFKTEKKNTTDKSFKEEFLNPSEEQAYAQTFIEHGKNKEKATIYQFYLTA